MRKLSYLIVGSGHRSLFYGRIAARYPSFFRALFLTRSEEKAAFVQKSTGVPATCSLDEALAFSPDFVVVAVDRGHMAEVVLSWAERGFPVAAETPLGKTREELDLLWRAHTEKGAKIISVEQYPRHPLITAGLSLTRRGLIGEPQSAYLSLVHDYHAAAMLRALLNVTGESYVMRGERTTAPALETDSRTGAILDGQVTDRVRDVIHITYFSGKWALYDFSSLQYRTFIHGRHLVLRGERGEWNDTQVCFTDSDHLPCRLQLMAELPARYRHLDTQTLRDLRKYWQPELFLSNDHDEFAIASMLYDMGDYLSGDQPPYPLADALDDAAFWLDVEQAVTTPWQPVQSRPAPWRQED